MDKLYITRGNYWLIIVVDILKWFELSGLKKDMVYIFLDSIACILDIKIKELWICRLGVLGK